MLSVTNSRICQRAGFYHQALEIAKAKTDSQKDPINKSKEQA